jgi:transmembrane sensor
VSATVTRQRLAALSPEDAAALWLVARDAGKPVEAGLFEEWLASSAGHRAAWDAAAEGWSLFDDAEDALFADLRAEALGQSSPGWRRVAHSAWRPLAVAAAVAAAVLGGVHWLQPALAPQAQVASVGTASIAAPRDRTRSLTLADGTQMTLDAATHVQVAFAMARRDIRLQHGRIWLSVAHDSSRPLVVAARDHRVTAVGTRFEVALEGTRTRVALFEGKVRVDGGLHPVVLRPGQQLITQTGVPDQLSATPRRTEALWREGLVEFDDVTLGQAAAALNPGSGAVLRIPDSAVAKLRVSGRFRLRDSERFARSVSELLPVRVVRVSQDAIELRQR